MSVEDMRLGFEKILVELDRLEESYSLDLADLKSKTELTVQRLNTTETAMVEEGTCNDTGFNLSYVGKLLGGASRERIRQIEASAIKKLRNPMTRLVLRKYWKVDDLPVINYFDDSQIEIELYDDSISRCELEPLLYVNVMGGSPYDAVKHGRIERW